MMIIEVSVFNTNEEMDLKEWLNNNGYNWRYQE